MRRILEFDDFVSNLSLSEVEQAEIKDFVKKYEKYMSFHDTGEFEKSLDDIVNDVNDRNNRSVGLGIIPEGGDVDVIDDAQVDGSRHRLPEQPDTKWDF